jgi:ribonuclease P protein component
VARTPHFALHRLVTEPASLEPATVHPALVSETSSTAVSAIGFQVTSAWIGALVPKRWAKRAVTRNMIKRQIYTMTQNLEPSPKVAAHVVRLRAGFGVAQYPSATSMALKVAVRRELEQLFARASLVPAIQPATPSHGFSVP